MTMIIFIFRPGIRSRLGSIRRRLSRALQASKAKRTACSETSSGISLNPTFTAIENERRKLPCFSESLHDHFQDFLLPFGESHISNQHGFRAIDGSISPVLRFVLAAARQRRPAVASLPPSLRKKRVWRHVHRLWRSYRYFSCLSS